MHGKFGVASLTLPVLTEDMRLLLFRVATGATEEEVPKNWFQPLNSISASDPTLPSAGAESQEVVEIEAEPIGSTEIARDESETSDAEFEALESSLIRTAGKLLRVARDQGCKKDTVVEFNSRMNNIIDEGRWAA